MSSMAPHSVPRRPPRGTPWQKIPLHTIMLFVSHPDILHKHCLQFLLGVKIAPRESEHNVYAKFWGDKQRALWYIMVFSGVVNWWGGALICIYVNWTLENSQKNSLQFVFSPLWHIYPGPVRILFIDQTEDILPWGWGTLRPKRSWYWVGNYHQCIMGY